MPSPVPPSLKFIKLLWPTQWRQQKIGNLNLAVTGTIAYNIQTGVIVTAIMEWNIGVPVSGQIRQTAQDRTDFAY